MKIRIALAALLIAAAGLPALLAAQSDPDCRDARTQADMNLCFANGYRAADAELNRVYARLRAALDAPTRPRLMELQRAWLRFRDLQCAFEASRYEGGSMQPMVRSGCLAAITSARTRELREMLKEEER